MSAKEYNVWLAEYIIEPFGEERQDLRIGMVVQSVLSPHVEREIELKECMLNFEPIKKQTPAEMFNKLKSYTIAMGGKVK
jgi:hypothetical protein